MAALRIAKSRDALTESRQALVDGTQLFHLHILTHIRVTVLLTAS